MSAAEKKITNEMIINYVPGEECRVAVVENGNLEEFHAERADAVSHVGNIYVGRVTNVEPAIQAAFVDFGLEANGFLHVSDLHPQYFPGETDDTTERVGKKTPRRDRPPIQECLRRGDEVAVQVLKEGVGTKGPTVTSYLSIPGRFLVMMPKMDRVGVSRKVEDEEQRRAMRDILDQLELPEGFGFIVRTAGMDRTKTELKRDLAYLQRLWKDMEKRWKKGNKPRLLYSESDLLVRALRDMLTGDIGRIVIDNEHALARAARFLKIVAPRSSTKLLRYKGLTPIFHAMGIEQQIRHMYSREVPLPSGGRLVIDETEALVAIDVNSGKMRDARDAETNAYRTNMEAADEICRQLRLRDLGGIVINDLIDMRSLKHRRELEAKFKENLKKDRARTTLEMISEFGILEMTRQRMRGSHESVHFADCPICRGRGLVQKPDSVAADTMRELATLLEHSRVTRIEMAVSPRIAGELLSTKRRALNRLERQSGKHVDVRVSEAVPVDRVTFYCYDERGADIDLSRMVVPPAREEDLEVCDITAGPGDDWTIDAEQEAEPEPVDIETHEQIHDPLLDGFTDEEPATTDASQAAAADAKEGDRGGRRRGRRGGGGGGRGGRSENATGASAGTDTRQRGRGGQPRGPAPQVAAAGGATGAQAPAAGTDQPAENGPAGGPEQIELGADGQPKRRRRRRRGRGGRGPEGGIDAPVSTGAGASGMPGTPGTSGTRPPQSRPGTPIMDPIVLAASSHAPKVIEPSSWDVDPSELNAGARPSAPPVSDSGGDDAPLQGLLPVDENSGLESGAEGDAQTDTNGAGPAEGPEGERRGRRRRRRGGRGGGANRDGAEGAAPLSERGGTQAHSESGDTENAGIQTQSETPAGESSSDSQNTDGGPDNAPVEGAEGTDEPGKTRKRRRRRGRGRAAGGEPASADGPSTGPSADGAVPENVAAPRGAGVPPALSPIARGAGVPPALSQGSKATPDDAASSRGPTPASSPSPGDAATPRGGGGRGGGGRGNQQPRPQPNPRGQAPSESRPRENRQESQRPAQRSGGGGGGGGRGGPKGGGQTRQPQPSRPQSSQSPASRPAPASNQPPAGTPGHGRSPASPAQPVKPAGPSVAGLKPVRVLYTSRRKLAPSEIGKIKPE